MPVFATPAPITVAVDLAVVSLHLVATDRAETVVTVAPKDPDKPADVKVADDVQVDLHDATLTVRSNKPWHFRATGGGKGVAEVTVELPAGSALRGSATGPLFAQGRLGDCSFSSGAGDVRIDDAENIDLRVSAGSVVVGHATGSANVVVSAGGVRLDELDGDATVKNTTGSTEIGRTAGTLRVNGSHGAITVDRSLGDTWVRCSYGNVRVERAESGRLQLETSYGAIDVGIPEGTAAWLDAGSQHGTVRNLLDDAAGPEESDRTVEVRAATGWGDVVIRRPHA